MKHVGKCIEVEDLKQSQMLMVESVGFLLVFVFFLPAFGVGQEDRFGWL